MLIVFLQLCAPILAQSVYKNNTPILAEALLVGTHHVVTRQFESVHQFMIGKYNNLTTTRVEQQFELCMLSVESREGHLQPVASQEAEYGNIGVHVTEIDAYRPQPYRRSEPPVEMYLPTCNEKTCMIGPVWNSLAL
ncbi:hypothetical protein DPMN_155704 [Dreissena polymorpha]|uniref:Uncharacterized protein n=1 Tax=Dreissena polymorpha TaxID=45954 RepID=A0A9D4FU73_DREPO|nr:hypothetical protein DPMN_155704 [Dreissena polymorpha]